MIRNAEAPARFPRRLADVLETLGLRPVAPDTADVPGEALAPVRGAALGTVLGAGCWVVVVVLAWTLAS